MRNAGLLEAINSLGWIVKDQGDISIASLTGKNYGPDYESSIVNIK
jgi:hypothetical protein